MSQGQKAWNKTEDTAQYYKDRAPTKLDKVKREIDTESTKIILDKNSNPTHTDIEKTTEPNFWDQNGDAIIVGSATAAATFIILLGLRQ